MQQFVIALGMFDGVHLGHRALLSRAAEMAHRSGDIAVAFTYTNHPRALLRGSAECLSTLRQREMLCHALGIDCVDAVPFTAEFAEQSPKAFLQWLLARYDGKIRTIVCGYDFRFGKNAEGDCNTLRTLCAALGCVPEILEPVRYRGEPCSSTRIRVALQSGALDDANAMLGRPYALTGRVVHNKAIGRTIGFPTANLDCAEQLLPMDGVYAAALVFGGAPHAAVTNIGSNPTVGGEQRTVETYALDGAPELYGKTVSVLFLRRLRDEHRFDSIEMLRKQIEKDAACAKKVFKETEKSVYNAKALW